MLWGLTSDIWLVLIGGLNACITIFLILVGWRQLVQLRRENRKWHTVEYVNRYDNDPILHECLKRLGEARRNQTLIDMNGSLKTEAATVLNYIDGLGVGIEQGLYVEPIARDHLRPIVIHTVKTYLQDERVAKGLGVDREHYKAAIRLMESWSSEQLTYNDQVGWLSRKRLR